MKTEVEKACFNPYSDGVPSNYYVLKKFIPDIFIPYTFNVSGINSPRQNSPQVKNVVYRLFAVWNFCIRSII